jgi:hypothetical protein
MGAMINGVLKMAYTSIMFENPNTGAIKEAPVGFSWTTLFLGFSLHYLEVIGNGQ